MKSWLQIDPEEFITTVALTAPQCSTNEQPLVNCSAEDIEAALHTGQITADQAIWLHNHNRNWEIIKA